MSWAVEEWKDGLPGKALQKIQEMESQLDKLKKERQQKQFQMDSLEATLQKQKQKMDSEKSEATSLKRENQSLVESCESLDKTRQKLAHDLQVKEQQVNYLEGQLNSSKKQIDRLEQDAKIYKSEFERSQTSHTAEIPQFNTPQKTFATPATPNHWQQDSRIGDLQEKYNREVEERKRLEAEIKVMHVKLLNQSSMSHKDIARQQSGSSIFPWQQEQTHSHQSLTTLETPSRRRNGPSWSYDDTPIKPHQQFTSGTQNDNAGSQQMEQLKNINQDLRAKVSELELHLQAQEKDVKNQINKFSEIQSQLEMARKDLAEKDKLLSKSRDELAKATGQYEQSVSKCSSVEQKLKQLMEEMNCQRHNSEMMHRSLEQKIKDQERESQKELAQLQSSHQALDQQFNQVKNKTSMEIQQAKKDNNILQSEMDKVTALKNRMEKDLDELKQKHLRSEQALQATQTKETEIKKKFDEMQREKNTISCQLEQGLKRVKQLEEEKQNIEQNLAKNRTMVDDLKVKTQTQCEELTEIRKKMDRQSASSAQELEHAKKNLAEIETKNMKIQAELHKLVDEIEMKANKICALEKENENIKMTTNSCQKEVAETKKEYETLLEWKTEKEQLISKAESNREEMLSKIADLERDVATLNGAHDSLTKKLQDSENDKLCISGQIDALKGELLNKCVELEEKGRAYEELQHQFSETDQKHAKEMENLKLQISQMHGQVNELEAKLHQKINKVMEMEQAHGQLLAEYESACDLAKSKDSIIEMNRTEITHLQGSFSSREQEFEKCREEKCTLAKEYEVTLARNKELDEAKLNMEQSQQEVLDKIASLESDMATQKSSNADIQEKYDDLSKLKEDLAEKVFLAEKREKELVNEVEALLQKCKSFSSLEEQFNTLVAEEENTRNALKKINELQVQTASELESQKTIAETLAGNVEEERRKASILEEDNTQLKVKLQKFENEAKDVSEKYESLQKLHSVVCQEKENHFNQVFTLTEALAEKDALIENFAEIQTDLETSKQLCITLKNSLQSLQNLYDSSIELNLSLEKTLQDRFEEQALVETHLKELTERHSKETDGFVSEMEAHVKKQKAIEEHFNILGAELECKRMEVRNASEKLEVVALEKSKLMEDLGFSNEKLNEVTESYQKVSKELENVRLNSLPHMHEIENLKAALTVLKNQEEAKSSEIKTLKEKLQEAQSEQDKGLEALKEKNLNMSKIEVQLEMLQMDLEDNETCLNAFDAQVEELRGNISVLEAKLSESEAQKSTLQSELKSVKEDYTKSILEVSKLSACLEETQKGKQCSSAVVAEIDSLQVTNEKLKVSLEQEICKQANLEAMYDNLLEQKNKLESAFKEFRTDAQNTQGKMDSLKQRNECLVCEIAQLQSHIEQLQYERTLAVNSDPDKEPTAYENDPDVSQDICEMPFANTSILPFEEDAALVRISSIDDKQPATQKEATDLSAVEEGQDVQLEQQNKATDLEEVSHVLEETVRAMEEQMGVKIEQVKLQHAEEIKNMEEQMLMIKNELEAKLRDEQQHAEILSSQLEATMQQLQELDLASSSLLAPETSEGVKTNKSDEQDDIIQNPDQSDSSEKTLLELTAIKETLEKREEELLYLQSQFELLTSEMAIRRDLCSELEGKVSEMEVEKENCTYKVTSITQANQKLNDYIVELTNEIDSLTLQLQTSKCQLSDVMEMMESLQVAKGEWNEKYFQTESELKRVRSEKGNLEKHILSMEADIEEMQDQKQKLGVELEAARRTNCSLEQQLGATVEEGGQLKEELVLCTEERESELHSLMKWKEKAELLEKRDADARELIKVLEDDIRAGKRQIEGTSEQINVLLKEKEQVLQQSEHIENTMTLLREENTNLISELNNLKSSDYCASRESENMSSKIHSLENENVRVSQSLESTLLEKGEIASRLISTQEEVAQMRRGIEKLKVRIESDERKKKHMSQLLKDAQRKADAVQDNIEKLEREKDISEQTLEDAFLQAETAKAELEELQSEQQELTKKIEEMTDELRDLKEEKCKLEQELQHKNCLIEELKLSNREASEKLKSAEQAMEEATVSQQQAIQGFQSKVGAMEEELLCCRNELESSDRKVQDLASQLLSLQSENSQFAQRVLEYEKCQTELHSSNQLLMKDLKTRQEEFSKDKAELQSQITELQALSLIREERDQLQNEKVILQCTITQLEKNAHILSAKIEDTQTSVTSLENQLNAMQLMNSELTQKNEMDVSALKEKMTAVEEMSAKYLSELNSYRSQDADVVSALKELQIKLETCEKDKAELDSKVVRVSKEKDSALSKISLWMKSCKQLESEKQALQDELEKTAALQSPRRQGDNSSSDDLQEELQELREALEEKSREADESMDRYCSLMVKVHKLEETNESLKNQVKQLTAQPKTSKSRRSLRSEKSGLENSNPVERADSMTAVKRQRADDTPNKAQEALHNITKRLKAAAATPKAIQDDEDFRPEGLPELVQKGFGDIPLGEMSPFIIRRTTVQRCSPRLAARTSATRQSPTSTEPSTTKSKRTAEGNTSKTVPEAVQNSAAVLISVSNSPQAKTCENSVTGAEKMLSRRSRSIRKTPEKRVSVSGQQNDNCQVQ
ncbi:Centromere protein F [Triplophysa tibetana]|uniref:Centromere protein F n=1 Tax=Triplophysa tibetana TaxID=1572043 RepID=A0A5A9NQD1_9TELE|nr:Centromere protein F [Triplophysa tibetana]